eukprot:1137828-Pelagomonas_calceolata.AAC.1
MACLVEDLEVVCTDHCVVAVRLLAGHQALARSDQDSIGTAGGASSLIRNAGVEEVGRHNAVRDLFSDVQVMLSQTVCAAYIHMYKVSPIRAFADHFQDHPASKCCDAQSKPRLVQIFKTCQNWFQF